MAKAQIDLMGVGGGVGNLYESETTSVPANSTITVNLSKPTALIFLYCIATDRNCLWYYSNGTIVDVFSDNTLQIIYSGGNSFQIKSNSGLARSCKYFYLE